jgi:RNA polymerase primary sigma factor
MTVRQKSDVATSDPVGAYLNEIGRHELLTAEDESVLAQAIEAGGKAQERLDAKDYADVAERRRLRALAAEGAAARERFINSNLRLVVAQARRYRRASGLDFIDLIQEGNLGLMRAVDKFEWRRGFKFSTYATWWIRQAIQRAIAEKSRVVRVPAPLHDHAAKVHAVADRLRAEMGREPDDAELALESGLEQSVVAKARALRDSTSLDMPVGEDGAVLGDFIANGDGDDDPFLSAQAMSIGAELRYAVGRLSERERRIIERRYGFADGVPAPLEEIGEEFGLTKERIRQIEKRALTRMRHPSFGMREEDLV